MDSEDWKFVVGIVFLGTLVAAVTFIGIFAIPIGIGAGIFYYFYKAANPPQPITVPNVKTCELGDYLGRVNIELEGDLLPDIAIGFWRYEDFTPPDPPEVETAIAMGRYKDQLAEYERMANSKDFADEVISFLKPFEAPEDGHFSGYRSITPLEIDKLSHRLSRHEKYFKKISDAINNNYMSLEYDPANYKGFLGDYLSNTPLDRLVYRPISVSIDKPLEHVHILGSSGSGKSHMIEHIISKYLEEDCCIVVIDSQSNLIEKLSKLDIPDDELCWITPKNKLALNLFDVDYKNIKDDDALVNNTSSLLEFVLEGLMDTPLTPRQRNLFQYSAQLLITIPGANILSLMDLLDGQGDFSRYIEKSDPVLKRFFEVDFPSKTYKEVKGELRYRLDTLLRNRTFRKIFSAEENRLNMYKEMSEKQLVLMDTSQHLLAESSSILGRLYIAMILQASYRRVADKQPHKPVYLIVDEAHEYFNQKLEQMLAQARKSGIGVFLAHQDLSQTDKSKITGSVMVNTATKFVHTRYKGDATKMAGSMKSTPDDILNQDEHHFLMFQSSTGPVSVKADSDPLGEFSRIDDLAARKQKMDILYGPQEQEEVDAFSSTVDVTDLNSDAEKKDKNTVDESGEW